jgi:hypothetical protein
MSDISAPPRSSVPATTPAATTPPMAAITPGETADLGVSGVRRMSDNERAILERQTEARAGNPGAAVPPPAAAPPKVPLALSISLAFTRDRAGRSTVPVFSAPPRSSVPLASMRLSRTTAKGGGVVRIRAGNYLSPAFTVADSRSPSRGTGPAARRCRSSRPRRGAASRRRRPPPPRRRWPRSRRAAGSAGATSQLR